ncbi:MAG: hypothetical protein GTO62_10835 [Planctomycetales bacterium]|nr:hypothetical protein [Planctomycetales bacterium]
MCCFIIPEGEQPFTHKECRACNYLRQQIVSRELAAGCGFESDPGYGGGALYDAIGDYPEGLFNRTVPATFVVNKSLDEPSGHIESSPGQLSLLP